MAAPLVGRPPGEELRELRLGLGAEQEDLAELAERALRVSERRGEALQRLAETRRKVRELGSRLVEQETLLLRSEGPSEAKDPQIQGAVGSSADGCRSRPANYSLGVARVQLRGGYPSRKDLAASAAVSAA
ncbi:unnamed protein product [Polarella glacialis]|uniref:Uncharacterized protein n=1 Tax=Polarella glacialis TaxID=89957 RepID=A0A813K247_POLGL|nr:unnamed protein product [Polarella glacialis]CAE8690461.1 unnamed protein product [Polarella glacialis]